MIKQIIKGKDGISHPEFDRYLGRAQNVDDDHDIVVERFHEDVIAAMPSSQMMMKRKVMGTKGTT